jgi:protoporphyrinogen oxidase
MEFCVERLELPATVIDNVVLGAGISGLAAAYEARRADQTATIFEARDAAGGLLDNFTVAGFRFDHAVHLSFATEPEVREVFDRAGYHTHEPEALNWDDVQWLRHPVQNNIFPLPAEEKVALIAGLAEAPTGPIASYADWLKQQYGGPIAERWPMRYTEKYWTLPASELGTDWIGQRVRRADLREVLHGAMSADTPHYFYAKEMRYPEAGGYRRFIEPMIEGADIRYNKRVTAITPSNRTITFADGEEIGYRKLVSTLPLPLLAKLIAELPEPVREDAGSLFATSVDLISIGFNRADVPPALWFYIYDRDILAARAYSPSWKAPGNAPGGCSSLQFEIYSSRGERHDPEMLKADTIAGLAKMGLATPDDIAVIDHRRIPYGNVVFDIGMEARRDRVLDWVRGHGIEVAGRFGEWAYLWSNQAMMSGLAAGRRTFC